MKKKTFRNPWHQRNLEKLEQFKTLKQGWFDEPYLNRGIPIPQSVIEEVEELLNETWVQPEIFPICDGGIQIEWERDDGRYLELIILPESWYWWEIFGEWDSDKKGYPNQTSYNEKLPWEIFNNVVMDFWTKPKDSYLVLNNL